MIKQYNQYIYKDGQWLLVGVSDQNNFITYVLQKDGDTITLKGDDDSTSDVVIKEFSDEAKAKLENIAAGAQVNVLEGVKVNGTKLTIDGEKLVDISVPTKLSQLTNDADYVTDANYVHTDNNYTTAEKNKLAGIAASADVNTIEQIKVNNSALTPDGNKIVNITVPTKLTDLTNDNNFVTDANYVHTDNNYTTAEKNKLAGLSNYDDTEIKQQIAQAGKIDTIKVNGTAQPVVDKTVSLTIPTVPTNISAFTNDKNYQTEDEVTSLIADAVGEIQTLEYSVVGSLPATGETGVIYLVSNGGANPNIYDEYIYINGNFEKIGTTEIDLSGYLTKTEAGETYARKAEVIQSDWSQNDNNQLDYVKNRTHYEIDNVVSNVIISNKECTFTITGSGDAFTEIVYDYTEEELAKINNLQDGPATIKVSINGHNFESAIEISNKTFESDLIRISTIDPQLYFIIVTDSRVAIGYEAIGYENAGDNYTINLIIEQNNKEIIKLDKKFLPDEAVLQDELVQSDWNENDETAIDYIKNRTHYKYTEQVPIVENCSYMVQDYDDASLLNNEPVKVIMPIDAMGNLANVNFLKEEEYTITFSNGFTRKGILQDYTEELESIFGSTGFSYYVMGSPIILNLMGRGSFSYADTEDDFSCLLTNESGGAVMLAIDESAYDNGNFSGSETLSLIGPAYVYKQIGLEYLPYEVGKNAEVFNDFENNLATGIYSHVEGRHEERWEKFGSVITEDILSINNKTLTFESGSLSSSLVLDSETTYYLGESNQNEFPPQPIESISIENSTITLTADADTSYFEIAGSDWYQIYTPIVYGAHGEYAHAEGHNTLASEDSSHTEGYHTKATGMYAHAEGSHTIASNSACHAEGSYTQAEAGWSHAEGIYTKALNSASHAEGTRTIAQGDSSHAEGSLTQATDTSAHAEGTGTVAGYVSHSEGYYTIAENYSHAEGYSQENLLTTDKAVLIDSFTVTQLGSSPVGLYFDATTHTGSNAYIGLFLSTATPEEAKEIPTDSTIKRFFSDDNYYYVEKMYKYFKAGDVVYIYAPLVGATGKASHVEGYNTVAASEYQHVQGKYNEIDRANEYAHIIGNGTDFDNRSNAHTVDWDGNAYYAGKVTVGADPVDAMDVVTKQYLENNPSYEELSIDFTNGEEYHGSGNSDVAYHTMDSAIFNNILEQLNITTGVAKEGIVLVKPITHNEEHSFCDYEIPPILATYKYYYSGVNQTGWWLDIEGNIEGMGHDPGETVTRAICISGGENLYDNSIWFRADWVLYDNIIAQLNYKPLKTYGSYKVVEEWNPGEQYYYSTLVSKDGMTYRALDDFEEESNFQNGDYQMSPVKGSIAEVTPTEGMQIRGEGVIRPDCSFFENISEADLFNYMTADGFAIPASEAVEDDMEVEIDLTSFPYRFHKIFDSSMGRFVHMISSREDEFQDIILCIPNEYITESGKISIEVFLDETILTSYVIYAIMLQDVVWDENRQFVSGTRIPTEFIEEGYGMSFKTNDFVVDTITSVSDHFSDTFKILKTVQDPKWELLHTHFIDGQFNDDEIIQYYDNIFNKNDSGYETARAKVKPGSIIFNTKGGYKNVHFSISLGEGGES